MHFYKRMGIEELEPGSKLDTEGNFCGYSQSRDIQQNKTRKQEENSRSGKMHQFLWVALTTKKEAE